MMYISAFLVLAKCCGGGLISCLLKKSTIFLEVFFMIKVAKYLALTSLALVSVNLYAASTTMTCPQTITCTFEPIPGQPGNYRCANNPKIPAGWTVIDTDEPADMSGLTQTVKFYWAFDNNPEFNSGKLTCMYWPVAGKFLLESPQSQNYSPVTAETGNKWTGGFCYTSNGGDSAACPFTKN